MTHHSNHPAPVGQPLPGPRPSITRDLARQTARNVLSWSTLIAVVVAVMLFATTPGLALWHDGRLTDLGALTVVPATISLVIGFLWWIAPHLDTLATRLDDEAGA